nr:hypothetical protein [Tanacetum cinerariifolium]
ILPHLSHLLPYISYDLVCDGNDKLYTFVAPACSFESEGEVLDWLTLGFEGILRRRIRSLSMNIFNTTLFSIHFFLIILLNNDGLIIFRRCFEFFLSIFNLLFNVAGTISCGSALAVEAAKASCPDADLELTPPSLVTPKDVGPPVACWSSLCSPATTRVEPRASIIVHSKSASGHDALAASTAKADPGKYDLNDLVSQQQEKTKSANEGLKTVHTKPTTGNGANYIKKEIEYAKEEFKTSPDLSSSDDTKKEIKLEDLSMLILNLDIDFMDLDSPKDDQPIIV